jgi:hypothetical protein
MLKKTLFALLVCAFLVGGVLLYFIRGASNYHETACNRMHEIANDPEKVAYIERWVNEKISDHLFLEKLGAKRKIFLDSHDSVLFSEIDLDFDYLGLNNQAAYVAFNRTYEDRSKFMNKSTIQSFSIGTGRYGLILNLNDLDRLGLEWSSDRLEHLIRIDEKLFVVCGSG